MDWTTIVTTISGAIGGGIVSIGGLEFFKWWRNRKKNDRIAEAEADGSEFGILRKQIEFLQEQLLKKEERFAEQTDRLRETTAKELELTREVTMLKTERSLKLCERRMCSDRLPQSGF